jgi:hypothetical protein
VGAGANLELLARSAKNRVARNVRDAGDHVEAFIEGENHARPDAQADLLPQVKHPLLERDTTGQIEARLGTELHSLRIYGGTQRAHQHSREHNRDGDSASRLPSD